jgi:hypothetical protein
MDHSFEGRIAVTFEIMVIVKAFNSTNRFQNLKVLESGVGEFSARANIQKVSGSQTIEENVRGSLPLFNVLCLEKKSV